MKYTWDGNTRELGAGSYPEPPDIPECNDPVCEECGWPLNVKEIDGKSLCWHCRCDHYLKIATDREKSNFIMHDRETMFRFLKNFWFENLNNDDQIEILYHAFVDLLGCKFEPVRQDQIDFISDFCEANSDEYGTFVEGIS